MSAGEIVAIITAIAALLGLAVQYFKNKDDRRKTDADAAKEISEAAATLSDIAEKVVKQEINRRYQDQIDWAARLEKLEEIIVQLQDQHQSSQDEIARLKAGREADHQELTRLRNELAETLTRLAAANQKIKDQGRELCELRERLKVTSDSLTETIRELYLAKERLAEYERKSGEGCDGPGGNLGDLDALAEMHFTDDCYQPGYPWSLPAQQPAPPEPKRWRLWDRAGLSIRCKLCGRGDGWTLENEPPLPTVFVCEHEPMPGVPGRVLDSVRAMDEMGLAVNWEAVNEPA